MSLALSLGFSNPQQDGGGVYTGSIQFGGLGVSMGVSENRGP